jgi:site-specific DNA-methyltransferase (adenine-specific)
MESFEIIRQAKKETDFKKEIKKLPYVFRDPVKFDKKADPKKFRFGSKIDMAQNE